APNGAELEIELELRPRAILFVLELEPLGAAKVAAGDVAANERDVIGGDVAKVAVDQTVETELGLFHLGTTEGGGLEAGRIDRPALEVGACERRLLPLGAVDGAVVELRIVELGAID